MNTTEQAPPAPAGIYASMAAILGEISPIAKAQRNNEQKFQYRGIDDVYNALNPLMAEHRVFMVPTVTDRKTDERTTKTGNTMSCVTLTVEYRFFHADGSFITCTVMGEGRDTADKATNKAMAAAHKYALLQTFCIPTADLGRDDPDRENPEGLAPRGTSTPQRLNLGSIKQTLAGLKSAEDVVAYWPKVSVQENHPDYQQLAHLFVTRKKELLQAAPVATAQPPATKPHVTLAAARTAFAECASPKELEACARRLAIAKDNPEHGAISEAYKARGKELSAHSTQTTTTPPQPVAPQPPSSPQPDASPDALSDAPADTPASIAPEQVKAIQAAYSGWPREERLADISHRLGRTISSVKELSGTEAATLFESFKSTSTEAAA